MTSLPVRILMVEDHKLMRVGLKSLFDGYNDLKIVAEAENAKDTMDIIKTISKELEIKTWQAEAVIKLIDEGNTIPFIARYRKEATGSLNDEVLRDFHDRLVYLRNLEEKNRNGA